jgi:small-conductance mechanosensitive channel
MTKNILITLVISAAILAVFYLFLFMLKKWAAKKRFFPQLIQKHLHIPGIVLCFTIIANVVIERLGIHADPELLVFIKRVFHIVVILAAGFFAARIVKLVYEVLIYYYSSRKTEGYSLRSAKTKFQMIQRILNLVVIFVTMIAILMTFPLVKQFGNTLLASAGVAGIILGFAAQKSLGTLFSGIQIAIAQPVKIDDIVVVDNQFGTIGEITLTYIVVNTWDEKRLIVPINYFLENSFENWTRSSPEVVGKVKIYVDFNLPIDELRLKFNEWLSASDLWDKRKSALLITDSNDETMEVRATMSAKDSGDAYDLECLIREKMITYIKDNYPWALPAKRIQYKPIEEQEKKNGDSKHDN